MTKADTIRSVPSFQDFLQNPTKENRARVVAEVVSQGVYVLPQQVTAALASREQRGRPRLRGFVFIPAGATPETTRELLQGLPASARCFLLTPSAGGFAASTVRAPLQIPQSSYVCPSVAAVFECWMGISK